MKIELTSLEKAVKQLEESLSFFNSDLAKKDQAIKTQFRSACIQAFEYTYELCVKMLRRQLGQIVANPGEIKEMDFMGMIRAAAEAGLVPDVVRFREYREKRNLTVHTYDEGPWPGGPGPTESQRDEGRADEIVDSLDAFLRDARFVLQELKHRNV